MEKEDAEAGRKKGKLTIHLHPASPQASTPARCRRAEAVRDVGEDVLREVPNAEQMEVEGVEDAVLERDCLREPLVPVRE